jgi:hypothetical protein
MKHRLFGTILVTSRWRTQLQIRRGRVARFDTMGDFMTSKEKAALFFKQEPLSGRRSSTPEYEQRAQAERTKAAMLRALRLARDAELASRPEETGVVTEKLTKLKPQRLRGPMRAHANAPNFDPRDDHRRIIASGPETGI